MSREGLDACIYRLRHAAELQVPSIIHQELQQCMVPGSLSPFFLRLLSYNLSRIGLFRRIGCIHLATLLTPITPAEHYLYPLVAPLLRFLECDLDPDAFTAGVRECLDAVGGSGRGEGQCARLTSLLSLQMTNAGGTIAALSVTHDTEDCNDGASSEESDTTDKHGNSKGAVDRTRTVSLAELRLRHLRRSIPRLRRTEYLFVQLLHAPARPAVCPRIVLLEGDSSCGMRTLLQTICYTVHDLHSRIIDPGTLLTVYSNVIEERRRTSVLHRALQTQCSDSLFSSSLASERVLSAVNESRQIIAAFAREESRRIRQKNKQDGLWGTRQRRTGKEGKTPAGNITHMLHQMRQRHEENSSTAQPSELFSTSRSPDNVDNEGSDAELHASSSVSSSQVIVSGTHNMELVLSYLDNYSEQHSQQVVPKWDPISLTDYTPIQHDIDTFNLCSAVSYSLASVHKEAVAETAKRSILIEYADRRYSYRRQIIRARLLYPVMAEAPASRLESDRYYFQSLNDCMDLHVEREAVERRVANVNCVRASLHAILCGSACSSESLCGTIAESSTLLSGAGNISTAVGTKTAAKKSSKATQKPDNKGSIMFQLAKAAKRPQPLAGSEVENETSGLEPHRKREAENHSKSEKVSDLLIDLVKKSDTTALSTEDINCRYDQSAGVERMSLLGQRGRVQREFVLINEAYDEDRCNMSYLSVPLCEVAPFNCSHLFSLRGMEGVVHRLKSIACEALVLACYGAKSMEVSRHACSALPALKQLANTIQFWGIDSLPSLFPSASHAASATPFADEVYCQAIETCSALCSGFLSLSGSSFLALTTTPGCCNADAAKHCMVVIDTALDGEQHGTAVSYVPLPRKHSGSSKRYQVTYLPDTRPVSAEATGLLAHLNGVFTAVGRESYFATGAADVEQKCVLSDLLLANGEVASRRMIDLVHFGVQMVKCGAPAAALRGIDVLEKMDPILFSKL